MSKKYSTTTTLVIVESPAKCSKIEQILGPGYKCIASYGHIRELKSLKDINIEENFKTNFSLIDNFIKKKQIDNLKNAIKEADEIVLATDNDREGEAISWHICNYFKKDIEKTKRIVFNEITESAIKFAIQNPKKIDINLVNAQKARQILDLLVGFKITPMLWKFINNQKYNSLSAGRCQTPALRLIYDNQKEIDNADTKKVYNTTGIFTNMNLVFELNCQFEDENKIMTFLQGTTDFKHLYNCSNPLKVFKKQPEPFTTSRLQQVSNNELHYSPKETMNLCQRLYESGYITYMRTDSALYNNDFIEKTKDYIIKQYDNTYLHENYHSITNSKVTISEFKEKNLNSKKTAKIVAPQEAHEAIRCTNISLKELPENTESREKKMYKLIWDNTLESCMSQASFYSVKATIKAFENSEFKYISELIDFPGWKIVKKKYSNDNKEFQYLQTIKQNSIILYKKIISKVAIKNVKLHYTESRLVQLLEEKGIGRPSTFSMLVDKIQERCYVKKENVKGTTFVVKDYELEEGDIYEIERNREFGNEKNKLIIQPLGIIVSEFLDNNFNKLLNYDFTKEMEEHLDMISKGNYEWVELCNKCNNYLNLLIENVKNENKSKYGIEIDENNSYIIGKFGPVIKTTEVIDGKENTVFKPVKNDINITKLENGEYHLNEIVDNTKKTIIPEYILGKFDNLNVQIKKGKFGLYIKWGENTKTLKGFGNRPIESITFDEIKQFLDEGSNIIREVSNNITIRKSKKGDYIFFKTLQMKKPKFFDINSFERDYKTCSINELKDWLKNTYDIN